VTKRELKDRLEVLRAAIEEIEDGAQQYTVGDTVFTAGNLASYYRQERKLEQRLGRLENLRPTFANLNLPTS
jgi:hypothetical protein